MFIEVGDSVIGMRIETLETQRKPVFNRLAEKDYGCCVVKGCGIKLNQYSYKDRCFSHQADYYIEQASQGKEVREERRVCHKMPDVERREFKRKFLARYRREM